MVPHRRTQFRLLGVLALLAPIEANLADTIHIPGDHPTTRTAIGATADSDEIIVASRSSNEAIDSFGKAVHPGSAETTHRSPTPAIAAALPTGRMPQGRSKPKTRKARSASDATTTRARQPTLSRRQTRRIAAAIMRKDVKLWHEINAPAWTLGRLYGDHFPSHLPGPANMTLLDYTVESLRAWRNISTSAVITTRKPYIDRVYRRLKRDVPDMRIIPGLKLSEYLPHGADYDFLADAAVWEAFAPDALRCAKITGTRQIVIMAEGPMAKFYAGTYAPNVGKFGEAMAPLRNSGLRVIWYPFGPHAGRPISDGVCLVRSILKAVPNSWFPSVGDGFPVREHDPDQNARRAAQIEATRGRIVHHIFVGPGKGMYVWSNGKSKQAYTPTELMRWLGDRALGDVWVFPGAFNSRAVGDELQSLLIPRGFRVTSDARTP